MANPTSTMLADGTALDALRAGVIIAALVASAIAAAILTQVHH